ncbi:MAG: FGGY family carbohydrate kinase [Candidatus Sigynarchaeota archaeon]
MAYRLAFDIGSKNVKCAVGNDNDDVVAMESIRPAVLCSEDGFSRCHDPSTYWNDIIELTRRTIAKARIPPSEIKYITSSSIRPSCAFVDASGNLIYIGSSFDLRGINSADTVEAAFEKKSGKSFFKATGHFPLLMYPPARYAWYKENEPDAFKRIAKYMPVDSWLLGKFGAEDHANIASAAESGFYDIVERDWGAEWADILRLPPDFFPPVVESGEIVGDASQEARKAIGLPQDAAIVSGMPDTQAALVGAGAIDELDAAIVVGSTTPIQMLKRDLFFDEKARVWTTMLNLKHVVDTYVVEASTGITGQIISWLAGLLFNKDGVFEKDQLATIDEEYALFDADEMARPSNSKDVLAFLGPDVLASSSSTIIPGVFVFPTPGTVDETLLARRQLIAAAFENIQFAAFNNVDLLGHIIGHGATRTFLLGGMTRSATFCQRFADLAKHPVLSTVEKEATLSGLFHACSIAAGDIKSSTDLKKKIESQDRVVTISPRKATAEVLQGRYSKWLAMRGKIKEL